MAKFLEYQGKEWLAKGGMPVPKGRVASSPEEAEEAARWIGGPVAVKGQVQAGGRGKAGLIKVVKDAESAKATAKTLFESEHNVRMLLVEEAVDIDREIYLSITVDPVESKIMLIGCAEGGVEIEKLAATDPDKIVTVRVDIAEGLGGYHVNNLTYGMGLSGDLGKQVGAVVRGLYKTFRAYDAQLAEINPLFITKDGKAIAGDGKLIIDDNSPDGTGVIVKDLQKQFPGALHLMERTGKQGLGTAYIAGFKWAIEHQYEYIFEMDADFSHNPKDLMNLLAACKTGGADMAIGSRYVTGVNVVNWPMGRVMMSYFASKYVRFVTGMKIHDTTAGFVCYRRRVLETIGLDSIRFKGYAFQIEMKFTTYNYGFTIKEVPIIFINRVLGESKMNTSIFGEAVFGVIRLKINSWFRKYPKQGN